MRSVTRDWRLAATLLHLDHMADAKDEPIHPATAFLVRAVAWVPATWWAGYVMATLWAWFAAMLGLGAVCHWTGG